MSVAPSPRESEPAPASSRRLPVLDGVRGIAILLVIVFHGSNTLPAALQSRRVDAFIHAGGHLGVDIFFVLSGYLITSLLLTEYRRSGTIDLGRFYLRRARRIFPAYYAFLAIVGALALAGIFHIPLAAWLLAAVYLTDYNFGPTAVWIVHTWSLAIEEQFYLFWPALIVLLGPLRVRIVALAVIVALPFVRVASYVLFPHHRPALDSMFHTRLDMLMFGAALAIGVSQDLIPTRFLRGRSGAAIAWAATAGLVAGLALGARFAGAYLLTIGYSITGICTAALILCLLLNPAWPATRLVSHPMATGLGRISYSLYLWQQLFLSPENTSVLGRFPLNFAVALACAAASYFLIERRFFTPVPAPRAALIPD